MCFIRLQVYLIWLLRGRRCGWQKGVNAIQDSMEVVTRAKADKVRDRCDLGRVRFFARLDDRQQHRLVGFLDASQTRVQARIEQQFRARSTHVRFASHDDTRAGFPTRSFFCCGRPQYSQRSDPNFSVIILHELEQLGTFLREKRMMASCEQTHGSPRRKVPRTSTRIFSPSSPFAIYNVLQ